jgi:hypothetical protein
MYVLFRFTHTSGEKNMYTDKDMHIIHTTIYKVLLYIYLCESNQYIYTYEYQQFNFRTYHPGFPTLAGNRAARWSGPDIACKPPTYKQ